MGLKRPFTIKAELVARLSDGAYRPPGQPPLQVQSTVPQTTRMRAAARHVDFPASHPDTHRLKADVDGDIIIGLATRQPRDGYMKKR